MAMTKLTFNADRADVALVRGLARSRKITLNELLREWLHEMAERQTRAQEIRALIDDLRYVDAGRKFSREEMNQR
jgi:Arc/MetJ-type ribon-helix-helix transcriptional regulator